MITHQGHVSIGVPASVVATSALPEVSLVMPYYRNPRMLARQLLTWDLEWSGSVKSRCEVIVVDDGSPEPAADVAACIHVSGLAVSVYRVLEDRPWHQHAARNLGAHVASGRWLLMTDMDHVVPSETMAALLSQSTEASKKTVFTFSRRDAPASEPWKSDHWSTMAHTLNDRGELKPHVNSFAIRRDFYWKIGGYDEEYCGVYGTDKLFRRRLWRRGTEKVIDLPLIRVSRDVIPDASTTTLDRGERKERKKLIARDKQIRGEAKTVKTLQFDWEKVA